MVPVHNHRNTATPAKAEVRCMLLSAPASSCLRRSIAECSEVMAGLRNSSIDVTWKAWTMGNRIGEGHLHLPVFALCSALFAACGGKEILILPLGDSIT